MIFRIAFLVSLVSAVSTLVSLVSALVSLVSRPLGSMTPFQFFNLFTSFYSAGVSPSVSAFFFSSSFLKIYPSVKFAGMHIILIKMCDHRTMLGSIKSIKDIYCPDAMENRIIRSINRRFEQAGTVIDTSRLQILFCPFQPISAQGFYLMLHKPRLLPDPRSYRMGKLFSTPDTPDTLHQ